MHDDQKAMLLGISIFVIATIFYFIFYWTPEGQMIADFKVKYGIHPIILLLLMLVGK